MVTPPAACAGVLRRNVPVSATAPASAGRAARIRMRTPQGVAPRPVVHRPVRVTTCMKCYHVIFTLVSQRVISLPPVRRGANGARREEKGGEVGSPVLRGSRSGHNGGMSDSPAPLADPHLVFDPVDGVRDVVILG